MMSNENILVAIFVDIKRPETGLYLKMRILIYSFAIGMSLPPAVQGEITDGALINGLWGPMPEWKRFTPAAFLEVPEDPVKDSVDSSDVKSDGGLYKTKRAGLATYLYRKAGNRNRLGYDPGKLISLCYVIFYPRVPIRHVF